MDTSGTSSRLDTVRIKAQQWADELIDFGRYNALLYYRDSKTATLDLSNSQPDSLAQLLGGRKTRLSDGPRDFRTALLVAISRCVLPVAGVSRAKLNRILEAERLAVSYVGGRPVLGELTDDPDQPMFSAPEGLENRLSVLLADPRMVMLLVDRAEQSRKAQASGAYLLALFGIGSFVEGLLLSVLMERYPELNATGFRGRDGRKISANRAGLEFLIDTAHDKRLIQFDAKSFMDTVRNFRNFIHSRQQLEHDFLPDEDTVALCWGPVHAVLNDLEEHHT